MHFLISQQDLCMLYWILVFEERNRKVVKNKKEDFTPPRGFI